MKLACWVMTGGHELPYFPLLCPQWQIDIFAHFHEVHELTCWCQGRREEREREEGGEERRGIRQELQKQEPAEVLAPAGAPRDPCGAREPGEGVTSLAARWPLIWAEFLQA